MAILSTGLLLSDSAALSSLAGIPRLASSSADETPSLRFVGFVVEDGREYAVLKLTNPLQKPIFYDGYDQSYPQSWYQRRVRSHWVDTGWHWCGTGMELHELQAESSIEMKVSSRPDENWYLSVGDRPPYRLDAPLRVGVMYGFNADEIERRLWSGAIQFDAIPINADEVEFGRGGGFF